MLFRVIRNTVLATDIAEYLGLPMTGPDCSVERACTPLRLTSNAVTYAPDGFVLPSEIPDDVLMLTATPMASTGLTHIVTRSPRADLARIVRHFFNTPAEAGVNPKAFVSATARIGLGVHVAEGALIDHDVVVGNGSVVLANAVLRGRVEIGERCLVKSNASIGTESFGFFDGPSGRASRPEIGAVVIGHDVWVGANATIERAGLVDTVIGDGVRIDDLSHIGSDVSIGSRVRVEAGAVICRGVTLGDGCVIGPRVVVTQNRKVGRNSVVGAGSVVLADVPDSVVAAGSPARVLRHVGPGDLDDPGF